MGRRAIVGVSVSALALAIWATGCDDSKASGIDGGLEAPLPDLAEPTAADLDLAPPPDLTPRADLGGELEVAVSDPTGMVDLSAAGSLDWIHWGLSSERSVTRKRGVRPAISDIRRIDRGWVNGGGELHQYIDNHVRFSWSDGTPTMAVNETSTGIFVLGSGRGFALSAPADEQTRTLRLYLSGFLADVEVTARLSDGSAYELREVITGRASGPGIYRLFTFVYRARTPGQTIDVEWINLKDHAGGGNVTVQAAALE